MNSEQDILFSFSQITITKVYKSSPYFSHGLLQSNNIIFEVLLHLWNITGIKVTVQKY